MTTMKSYTNVEQSRKLAEILPVESADMNYRAYREEGGIPDYQVTLCPYQFASWIGVPCWSLAALLDVLPHRIDDRHALVSGKLSANEGWYVCYDDNGDIDYYVHNSSLINACYEMILKLHEQKLL